MKNITIVGGGSAGWMTAATLIKAFPNRNINVIESKDVPIVGVGESTLGFIRRWTRFIGIDESSFIPHTDASYKLSIKFTDFYKKDSGGFHYPFGFPIIDGNRNPISDWHLKKYFYPETPIEDMVNCLIPSSALFNTNKFSLNENEEFDNFNINSDVAYHFDAVKFGHWLKEYYCKPRGVNHIVATVKDVKCNEYGIEHLVLDDGSKINADLYIDCTGFRSLLLGGALNEPFISYSDMLPNNKAWATRLPYKNRSKELEGFTNSTAIENGWVWNISLWSRLGTGYVYSDKFVSDEEALTQYKNYLMSSKMVVPRTAADLNELEYRNITMRVGIHERTFVKNVVAIGLSAGFIEPLESNGLFSVHEFLFNLIDVLQRDDVTQFDRDMYNVSVRDRFAGFAKFVAMHYALSLRNDTEYWRAINNKNFTDLYNDPYFPFMGTTDSFARFGKTYMNEWQYDFSGIPYIATGMHYFLMNNSRISDYQYRNKVDLYSEIQPIIEQWEERKHKWNIAAEKSPTLEEFLNERFYHETI